MRGKAIKIRFRQWSAAALIAFALAPATSLGQQKDRLQPPSHPAAQPRDRSYPGVIAAPDEDYHIGPSDVLDIQVEDAPELSRVYRVTSAGAFLMPYLGRIAARNKTPEDLTRMIEDGLRGRYLKDPKVTVVVREYNSRSFFIQGAVQNPGVYQIEGRSTLLKLITVAGGLSEKHGTLAYIIREIKSQETKADPQSQSDNKDAVQVSDSQPATADGNGEDEADYDLLTVNINGLLKGSFSQNIAIEPGDIINIPPADVFYVAGEVREPGSFPLKEGTTLRQAISMAQGATFKASVGRGIIFREDPASGKRQEIAVDIGAVMSGKKEDVPIKANDIIIIPNSRLKSVAGTILSAFGVNAWRFPGRY